MADDGGSIFSNNIVILLIAMGSAAFVVSMYHVIAICWCNQRMTHQNPPRPLPPTETTPSVADMIPIHTYHKKKVDHTAVSSGDRDDEGDTCAVCLGDYEDGEELKTMPECMHSFHVPCIDMWLSSHSSCPICRSSATPSVEMQHSSDNEFNYAAYPHHSIDMTQFTNGFLLRR